MASLCSTRHFVCMRFQCKNICTMSSDDSLYIAPQQRIETFLQICTVRQTHARKHTNKHAGIRIRASIHICKDTNTWRAGETINTYRCCFSRQTRQTFPTKDSDENRSFPGSRGKRVPRTRERKGEKISFIHRTGFPLLRRRLSGAENGKVPAPTGATSPFLDDDSAIALGEECAFTLQRVRIRLLRGQEAD